MIKLDQRARLLLSLTYLTPVKGSTLERYNPINLYFLGFYLSRLDALSESDLFGDVAYPLTAASINLGNLAKDDTLEISVGTREAAKDLADMLQSITRTRAFAPNLEGKNPDESKRPIKPWVSHIKSRLDKFETRFISDCMSLNVYNVPQLQAYNSRILVEQGERLLPEAALNKLKEQRFEVALHDVRIAGRCLAFDLWTATGFHIARATERLIQEYWLQERKSTSLPAKGSRTWVNLCKDLQGTPPPKPGHMPKKNPIQPAGSQRLVKFLLVIGEEYRNPLIHPDQSLEQTDGSLLLEGCMRA